MQVEELAPGVGHAADFGDALLEAGLVAREIITDQLAAPGAEGVTCVFAGAARAEVVDHRFQVGKRSGAVGPDISPMGFLLARGQHLHGVSSAWTTPCASTASRRASTSGWSCTPVCPTHCANVERAIARPARPKIFSCRYSGR